MNGLRSLGAASIATALAALMAAAPAAAQDCGQIRDAAARLTCYDRAGRAPQGTPVDPGSLPSAAAPQPPPRPAAVPYPVYPVEPRQPSPADLAYDPLARPAPADPRSQSGGVRNERREQGPVADKAARLPLLAVRIGAIVDRDGRWQATVWVTNQGQRTLDADVLCTMTRQGATIAEIPVRPAGLAPGEIAALDAVGPLVTDYYVDGMLCRVIGPII